MPDGFYGGFCMCRDGDSAEETATKLTLVAIYNERLSERKRRREFLQASGFLDVRKQQVSTISNNLLVSRHTAYPEAMPRADKEVHVTD